MAVGVLDVEVVKLEIGLRSSEGGTGVVGSGGRGTVDQIEKG